MAWLAFLLDAGAPGNLKEDRPDGNEIVDGIFDEIAEDLERRRSASENTSASSTLEKAAAAYAPAFAQNRQG